MRRLLLGLVVVLAACGGAGVDETERSTSGVIVESGRLGLVHLRPGDCIRDALAAEVDAMVGVPCAQPHRGQVVAVGTADEHDFDDPAAIDDFCTLPVEDIGRRLQARTDLPQIDVALLFAEDGSRAACILEFAEPVTEDLVRTAA